MSASAREFRETHKQCNKINNNKKNNWKTPSQSLNTLTNRVNMNESATNEKKREKQVHIIEILNNYIFTY